MARFGRGFPIPWERHRIFVLQSLWQGTATSSLVLGATATGKTAHTGIASTNIVFGATATGKVAHTGIATTNIILAVTDTSRVSHTGIASTNIVFGCSAIGRVTHKGIATTNITLAVTDTARVTHRGVGTIAIVFGATAAGTVSTPVITHGSATLSFEFTLHPLTVTMTHLTFTPPTYDIGNRVDYGYKNPAGIALMTRYRGAPVGLNVYLLTNNTFTTSQPTDPSLIRKIYFGGHLNLVSSQEATALQNAGYTVT